MVPALDKDKRSRMSANDEVTERQYDTDLKILCRNNEIQCMTFTVSLLYLVVGGLAGTTGLAAIRGGTEE